MTDKSLNEILLDSSVIRSADALRSLSDHDLALAESSRQSGSTDHILIQREWQRRMISHQLTEQYKLDERLSKTTRWWGLGSALIGAAGTLVGTCLGFVLSEHYGSKVESSPAAVQATTNIPDAAVVPTAPETQQQSATSASRSSSKETRK